MPTRISEGLNDHICFILFKITMIPIDCKIIYTCNQWDSVILTKCTYILLNSENKGVRITVDPLYITFIPVE